MVDGGAAGLAGAAGLPLGAVVDGLDDGELDEATAGAVECSEAGRVRPYQTTPMMTAIRIAQRAVESGLRRPVLSCRAGSGCSRSCSGKPAASSSLWTVACGSD